MIEADLHVAGRYAAILTPFDCPTLGLVCGVRTAHESAIWIMPDTQILNPESLGRIHSSIRECSADTLLGALEHLSSAGPVALACDEAEKEISDLREKVPGGPDANLLLCSHLRKPQELEKIFDLLTSGNSSHLAFPLYRLLNVLSRFERGLFLPAAPALSAILPDQQQGPSFQELISFADLTREIEQCRARYSETDRESQLKAICADGLYRQVAVVRKSFGEELDRLRSDFPNFAAVTTFLKAQVELGLRRKTRAQAWQPILLVGPPGCGKSAYCRRVAEVLENDYFELDLSHLLGRFELVGLHPSWKSGTSGFLANSLIRSRYINPVMFFDEVDKADTRHQDGSLMSSLLTLLEADSSRKYVDQFIRVRMRADKILWFFAANDSSRIPETAISRLQIFNISQPSALEQTHIIPRMYEEISKSSDLVDVMDAEIKVEVVEALISKSVREVKLRLQLAIANAALRLRSSRARISLITDDVPNSQKYSNEDFPADRTLH